MRTAEVGNRAGYSAQQVRDLERLGVIPKAGRSSNGYRQYGTEHTDALLAYRGLAIAAGPVRARRLMPAVLTGSLRDAALIIDDLHADIARERVAVLQARDGLDLIHAEAGDVFDDTQDTMTIAELAQALGVRASTLRHWESEGLVHPDRVGRSSARQYGWRAIIEARIVAALRAGGHRIPVIGHVLDQVRDSSSSVDAHELLASRIDELATRSLALLEAAAYLHSVIRVR